MAWKSSVIKPVAAIFAKRIRQAALRPDISQKKVLSQLLKGVGKTEFGKDHFITEVSTYEEWKQAVPIGDYESLRPYIEKIVAGHSNVLWPGRPIYFAKTSGTTSGTKLIPITKSSVPYHVNSARNAMFCYVDETGDSSAFDGRMIFLSGSPALSKEGGILTGRLSGIVNHHIPSYVKKNQLPSWKTNCIEDWETKLNAIVKETIHEDLRLIGGIPSWVQMYFDQLLECSGKPTIKALFPNLSVYVYGGVNYAPYRKKMEEALGASVNSIETYPASEGFIAFQDSQTEEGLLLQTNAGIFYEFIPLEEVHSTNPTRLSLQQVETGKQYAIVLNTNAGLWGYLIGDTVRFVSTAPYRLLVTGRIKHFISAFGEHVIAEEVEGAMQTALAKFPEVSVAEFHVAPLVQPEKDRLPRHQWFVSFERKPENINLFAEAIDSEMQNRNPYYYDLIAGKITETLEIVPLKPDAFIEVMRAKGKLGGQNKVPRLSDERSMAEELQQFRC
jgi:hypothetical protein